jgi:hypothetical protein
VLTAPTRFVKGFHLVDDAHTLLAPGRDEILERDEPIDELPEAVFRYVRERSVEHDPELSSR